MFSLSQLICFCALFLCFVSCEEFCTYDSHKLINGEFFQRVELRSVELCLERCIESIQFCAVLTFTHRRNNKYGLCELHRNNSLLPIAEIVEDDSANSTNVVIEILDKCTLPSEQSNILDSINPAIKQKFEMWSNRNEIEIENQETDNNPKFHWKRTDSLLGIDRLIAKADNSGRKSVRMKSPFRSDLIANFESLQSSKSPENSKTEIPEISTNDRNFWEAPDLVPIQPSQVLVRGAARNCKDANCYAPSTVRARQQVNQGPCSAYSGAICRQLLQKPLQAPPLFIPDMVNPCTQMLPIGCATSGWNQDPVQTSPSNFSPVYVRPKELGRPTEESNFSPWSEWSSVSHCSVTCGSGFVEMERQCLQAGPCSGYQRKTEVCERSQCEQWSSWSAWSECTKSCGDGEQERSRKCFMQNICDGPSMMVQPCKTDSCPQWSDWGPWEECSVTCDIGQQKRFRLCKDGLSCPGRPSEARLCEQKPCPKWTPWQSWSECSATCGGGERIRERSCDGTGCAGRDVETMHCNTNRCPQWTSWTQWTSCSATCGDGGTKLRTRVCFSNNIKSNHCEGPGQDQTFCHLAPCPEWDEWGSWSKCSASCGHGREIRKRKCLPEGSLCIGGDHEFRFCQLSVCPYWSSWSDWSGCTVTCGWGTCTRSRKCMYDDLTGLPNIDQILVEAGAKESAKEAAKAVLIESDKQRMKTIKPNNESKTETFMSESAGGQSLIEMKADVCLGADSEQRRCYAGHCCELGEWFHWSQCSASCGGGQRRRIRQCTPTDDLKSWRPNDFSEQTQQAEYSHFQAKIIPVSSPALNTGGSHNKRGYLGGPVGSNQGRMLITPITPVLRQPLLEQCKCHGERVEIEDCKTANCPEVDATHDSACAWSNWNEWCDCMGPCNLAKRARSRHCVRQDNQQAQNCYCDGESLQSVACVSYICSGKSNRMMPTFRNYPSQYGNYEFQRMQQTLQPIAPTFVSSNAYPKAAYFRSELDSAVTEKFGKDEIIGCSWSNWNAWGNCAERMRMRSRSCVGSSITKIRCECSGSIMQQMLCEGDVGVQNSQIHSYSSDAEIQHKNLRDLCSWSQWNTWSSCSRNCKFGKRVRNRRCSCLSCDSGAALEMENCVASDCESV